MEITNIIAMGSIMGLIWIDAGITTGINKDTLWQTATETDRKITTTLEKISLYLFGKVTISDYWSFSIPPGKLTRHNELENRHV